MSNAIVHPLLAREIASAINKRAVATDMIDAALKKRPYDHAAFQFWAEAHREASYTLIAMGIDVVTYDEPIKEQVER